MGKRFEQCPECNKKGLYVSNGYPYFGDGSKTCRYCQHIILSSEHLAKKEQQRIDREKAMAWLKQKERNFEALEKALHPERETFSNLRETHPHFFPNNPKTCFESIDKFPVARYAIDVSWEYLRQSIQTLTGDGWFPLEMNPPYQRGYVWTVEQKIAFVEFQLRDGVGGDQIYWNCRDWDKRGQEGTSSPLEIVDGKQRLMAVLDFLDGHIPAFGSYFSEYEGRLGMITPKFRMNVNNLETELEVVQWYLAMNTGGSIHTAKDLAPALELLQSLQNGEFF